MKPRILLDLSNQWLKTMSLAHAPKSLILTGVLCFFTNTFFVRYRAIRLRRLKLRIDCLCSDAFLYSSLTVFKQEVPSPTTQDKNGGGGGGGQQQQLQQQPSAGNNNAELVAKQRQAIINGNGHGIIMQANNANNMQIESSENNSLMNNHQQICSNIQQNGNINNNAGNEGVNFQQFLQDDSYDKINGKVTPPRSEKPKLLHTDDCR